MPSTTLPDAISTKKPWKLYCDVFCGPVALISCILAVLLISQPIGTLFVLLGVGLGLFWLFTHWSKKDWLQWYEYRDAWKTWEEDYNKTQPDKQMEAFFTACREYDEQYAALQAKCVQKRQETIRTLRELGNSLADDLVQLNASRGSIRDTEAKEEEKLRAKFAEARAKVQKEIEQEQENEKKCEEVLNRHTLLDASYYHLAERIKQCLVTGRAESLKEALNLAIVDHREACAEEKRRREAEQLLDEQFRLQQMEYERQTQEREHQREMAARAAEQAEAQAKRDREDAEHRMRMERQAKEQAAEQAKAQARRDREAAEHERRMEEQARRQAAEQERHNRQMEWNASHPKRP